MKSKAIIILILFYLSVSFVNAQDGLATVTVKWERAIRGAAAPLRLYKIVDGNLVEQASSTLNAGNMFYFICMPEPEGFYYIGFNPQPANRFTIYLKRDERVNLTVTSDSWNFTGNVSAENSELRKWYEFIQPIQQRAIYFQRFNSTFQDFFPLLAQKAEDFKTFPPSQTRNRTFNRKFEDYKKIDFASTAVAYMFAPRGVHPGAEDFPDYFRNLETTDFTQSVAPLMNYPGGLSLIDRIIFVKAMAAGTPTRDPAANILQNIDALIANDTIKGELAVRFASQRQTYLGLLDYQDNYGKYLITERQKNIFTGMVSAMSEVRDGGEVVDFKFPDINGKEVALSDFKGKVVYIDVWATWCGPCKQEMPFFRRLEEEFRSNPDIVFLSVSVDAQRDFEKWKTYVAQENMQGVQLFAGERARDELMTPYRIAGIPRFMLVGKDGNLIAIDAPRPSTSEIRSVLRALLAN